MRRTVRILEALDAPSRTVIDVIATNNEPVLWENPEHLLATYPYRLKALVAARLVTERRGVGFREGKVIPIAAGGQSA